MTMKSWNVVVHKLRSGDVTLGRVQADTEALARCAALHEYGLSEDDILEAKTEESELPPGIQPDDDFSVVRA